MRIFVIFAVGFSLTACGGGGSSSGNKPVIVGQGDSFEDAWAAAVAFGENIQTPIFEEEGVTAYADLPSDGTANYAGGVTGLDEGGTSGSPAIDYVANLDLTVDFETKEVTGTISDFVTSLAGFENPEGEIDVTGFIFDDGDDAGIEIDADGELTSATATATYGFSGDGVFAGNDARTMGGPGTTDFTWIFGPDTGTTSFSDNGWGALEY